MWIVCQLTIVMKYHALFVIFEKAAKFEIVVCWKLYLRFKGYDWKIYIGKEKE